jgi:hypothetical protein
MARLNIAVPRDAPTMTISAETRRQNWHEIDHGLRENLHRDSFLKRLDASPAKLQDRSYWT